MEINLRVLLLKGAYITATIYYQLFDINELCLLRISIHRVSCSLTELPDTNLGRRKTIAAENVQKVLVNYWGGVFKITTKNLS